MSDHVAPPHAAAPLDAASVAAPLYSAPAPQRSRDVRPPNAPNAADVPHGTRDEVADAPAVAAAVPHAGNGASADHEHDPVVALARRLTTPVDVDILVRRGVLRASGPWYARWYQILDEARLPDWARCQIAAVRETAAGPLVRFGRPNRVLAQLYRELTGTRPPRE